MSETGQPTDDTNCLRQTFPPSRRLRRRGDFETVYSSGQRVSDAFLIVLGILKRDEPTRIGLSVTRRHGNSVARHRLKRQLREAYRLDQHQLPEGLDLVLIPGKDAAIAELSDFRRSLGQLVKRLHCKLVTK